MAVETEEERWVGRRRRRGLREREVEEGGPYYRRHFANADGHRERAVRKSSLLRAPLSVQGLQARLSLSLSLWFPVSRFPFPVSRL